MGALLFEVVFLDFFLHDLVADIPFGVIVPSVSAWVD
jgi:hypothetical protein